MASFAYNDGALKLQDGSIQWTTDVIRARMVGSTVTPNKDDTSITGYTNVGGVDKTLVACTRTKDTALDRIVYDADNLSDFVAPPAGPTARYVIIFKFVTNDAASIPIFCIHCSDLVLNGTDVTAPFLAGGIFYSQQ
jgi:hypothetical protein